MTRNRRRSFGLAGVLVVAAASTPSAGGADANEAFLKGAPRVLCAEQLDRLEFDSRLDPNLRGRSLDPNHYKALEVAVRLAKRRHRLDEAIWAYLIVRNRSAKCVGLDMAFDPLWEICINSWCLHVRREDDGDPTFLVRRVERVNSGPLVSVDPNGYYCARVDLRRLAWALPVRSGTYGLFWDYARLRSNKATFTVTNRYASTRAPRADDIPRAVAVAQLLPAVRDLRDRPAGKPVRGQVVDVAACQRVRPRTALANLATGIEGRYYPDLLDLPTAEGGIRCTSCKARGNANGAPTRLTVTLAPAEGGQKPYLATRPRLYLIALGQRRLAAERRTGDAKRELALQPAAAHWADVDKPFTLQLDLPPDWPARLRLAGTVRLAVVISTEELGRDARPMLRNLRRLAAASAPWRGAIRSPYVVIELPGGAGSSKP
jgi:hypothetical protein